MAAIFTHTQDRYGFKRISRDWKNIYICILISPTGKVDCFIDIFDDDTQETYSYAKHDVGSLSAANSCIRKICQNFGYFRYLIVSNNIAITKIIEMINQS